jgi:SAM-dependent methyltransferase
VKLLLRIIAPARTAVVGVFERILRIQTHGDIPPTGWIALWGIFRDLDVGRDDVFVDLGCAKGRVVYMAARRPFKRVIGIERHERLSRTARANIERVGHRLACREVVIHTLDVRDWEIPDDLTVAYFFVPFEREVLEQVSANLSASLQRRPRRLRLLCLVPLPEELQALQPRWQIERIRPRMPFYIRHRFYETASMATFEPRQGRA